MKAGELDENDCERRLSEKVAQLNWSITMYRLRYEQANIQLCELDSTIDVIH